MTRILLIAWVSAFLFTATAAGADEPPVISVNATGTAFATPEHATMNVTVSVESKTAQDATRGAAGRHKAVVAALRALGIEARDILTTHYDVSPVYDQDERGRQGERRGFASTHTLQVRIRKLDRVGDVIDAVVGAGADRLSSLQFVSMNEDSIQQAALTEATKSARARAETIARALGGQLGELVDITTQGSGPYPMVDSRSMMEFAAVKTEVSPGLTQVSASVTARWRFKPGR